MNPPAFRYVITLVLDRYSPDVYSTLLTILNVPMTLSVVRKRRNEYRFDHYEYRGALCIYLRMGPTVKKNTVQFFLEQGIVGSENVYSENIKPTMAVTQDTITPIINLVVKGQTTCWSSSQILNFLTRCGNESTINRRPCELITGPGTSCLRHQCLTSVNGCFIQQRQLDLSCIKYLM